MVIFRLAEAKVKKRETPKYMFTKRDLTQRATQAIRKQKFIDKEKDKLSQMMAKLSNSCISLMRLEMSSCFEPYI